MILISWGSTTKSSTIPQEKLSAIVEAMSQFKEKFIIRWSGEFPNKPSNVFARNWLPQRDILCHPKVKAFWTHGGLGGSSETAYCGVPVVATPFDGDQFLNSVAFVHRGAGVILPYEDFTTENIVKALKFALKPSTREVAKQISYSYTHRPMSPLETAVYWVEHTIATGGAFMKPSTPDIPWYIVNGFDVYAVIIGGLLMLVSSWLWLLKRVAKRDTVKIKRS